MLEGLSRVSSVLHAQGFYLDQLSYHTQLLQQRVASLVVCVHSLKKAALSSAEYLRRRGVSAVVESTALAKKGVGFARKTASSVLGALAREQERVLRALAEDLAGEEDSADTSVGGECDSAESEEGRCTEVENIRRLLPRLVKRIR